MARRFSWDRATITPTEITTALVSQYGPEQPITVEMDDRSAQIPYATAMATFECHRCGASFSTTPKSLLNSYYTIGSPCLKCANVSDEELKARKKEEMNEKALEVLKERGIDPFEDTPEEEKAKMEAEEDARVALTSEDYADAFDEMNASSEDYNDTFDETNDISEETDVDVDVEEETDDYSEYMMTDDDDKTSVGDFDNSEAEEMSTENYEAEAEDKLAKAEEEKIKAVEEAKSEVAKEMSIKAQEEEAKIRDRIRAEMEAKMKAELEAEKAKATAEIEAAKKAKEEAEKFAAEANARAQEAEEALKVMQDDSEESVFVEPDEESDDYEDDQSEEYVDVEEETMETETDEDVTSFGYEEPEEEFDQVVGNEGYSQEEFDNEILKRVDSIKSKLGFNPWISDKFDTDDDGHIIAVCRQCNQKTYLEKFDDVDGTVVIGKNFCKKFGLNPVGKINNNRGEAPVMHRCACCVESVINNGFNEYHRNTIKGIAAESHFNIVNENNHWFIPEINETFTVECNGINKDMTFAQLVGLDGADLRQDPMFKAVESKNETAKTITPKQPVIKPLYTSEKTTIKATPSQPAATNVQQQKPKIVLKAKAPEQKIETSKSSESVNNSFVKEKPASTMFDKYNKGPNVENAVDTNAELEEERYAENENIVKNTIFKADQKLILSNKTIAKLNGKVNPFEREKGLKDQFQETEMAKFISDLSSETEVKCNLILSNKTYELPVIDFESGLRIICADLEERSIPNVPFDELGNPRHLPFTFYNKEATSEIDENGNEVFKRKPKKFNWVILFSDSVEARREATFAALVKYINPDKLAYHGDRIKLDGNLDIEYTTNDQFLRDFDVRYSPFPSSKPKTGQLGVIATWRSTKQSTTRDVLRFQNSVNGLINVANLDSLADENQQYMVASIRYIERYNKESNRVTYTITEYVEIGSCFIADGLTQCIRGLLKEYTRKYPEISNTAPFIVVECDPNNFTSPSIKNYVENRTLVPVNDAMRQMMYGSAFKKSGIEQYLRYSYLRRPEYRTKASDNYRHDMRMFSTGTLIRTMADEIKQAGIANTIRDNDVKNRFIANMGYVKSKQGEIKEMFVNQSMITSLLYDYKTAMFRKHIDADGNMYQKTQLVTDSTSGIGINNIYTNPNLINRYQNILNNGSPEAKQAMMNLMMQNNPMMASMMGNGMQQNNFQMGMMNPMMGMPGMMNPMMMGMNQFGGNK